MGVATSAASTRLRPASSVNRGRRVRLTRQTKLSSPIRGFPTEVLQRLRTSVEIRIRVGFGASGATRWIHPRAGNPATSPSAVRNYTKTESIVEYRFIALGNLQGGPRTISHYQVTLLNRIKTVIKAKCFINCDYKMSKRML